MNAYWHVQSVATSSQLVPATDLAQLPSSQTHKNQHPYDSDAKSSLLLSPEFDKHFTYARENLGQPLPHAFQSDVSVLRPTIHAHNQPQAKRPTLNINTQATGKTASATSSQAILLKKKKQGHRPSSLNSHHKTSRRSRTTPLESTTTSASFLLGSRDIRTTEREPLNRPVSQYLESFQRPKDGSFPAGLGDYGDPENVPTQPERRQQILNLLAPSERVVLAEKAQKRLSDPASTVSRYQEPNSPGRDEELDDALEMLFGGDKPDAYWDYDQMPEERRQQWQFAAANLRMNSF